MIQADTILLAFVERPNSPTEAAPDFEFMRLRYSRFARFYQRFDELRRFSRHLLRLRKSTGSRLLDDLVRASGRLRRQIRECRAG